jgi:hypothetical protein
VTPFKEHFIADLRQPINNIASKQRRKRARQSLRRVSVEISSDPLRFLDEWVGDLYATLVEKHRLQGIKAFSREAFAKQLSVPGVVMFRAINQDITVGADVWYVQGEVAYGHLAAYNPEGYRLRASYALLWSAIEYFVDKVRWLSLGAGAGIEGNDTDGLTLFKRGWSTATRTAYFCGRILNERAYREIVKATNTSSTEYFPAYREGEFK